MPSMDIFRAQANGAFSMISLTRLLLDMAHIPMRLGRMGLFESEGIRTRSLAIERQGNTLQLVPTSPRGGPRTQNVKDDRSVVNIPSVRLAMQEVLMADEVQDVRALGSENELMSLQEELNRRNARMSNSIEATLEFHRMGALKGIVLDSNNVELLNLFTVFGVSEQTEVDFDLDNASPASGALRKKCSSVVRTIRDALDGLPYKGVHAMCSTQFYDDLTAHPEYREFQKGYAAAQGLAAPVVEGQTYFGGITFEEYRGAVGGTQYVEDDKARIFPVGVPGLFVQDYSPAEFEDTVNTIGLPRYAMVLPDAEEPRSKVKAIVQSHPITLCTRPRTLIKAKRT